MTSSLRRNCNTPRRGFWKDITIQRAFFDNLAKKLRIFVVKHVIIFVDIKTPDEWKNVSIQQVYQHGGAGLLRTCYKGSLIQALRAVYPDQQWKAWHFSGLDFQRNHSKYSKHQHLLFKYVQQVRKQYFAI